MNNNNIEYVPIDSTIKDPEIHINVTEMNFTMLNEWRAVCKELYYKMTDLLMEDGIDPEAKFCMELKLGKQSSGTIYKLINLNNENTP